MTSLAMMATGGGIPIRQTKFAPDGVKFCEDVSEGRWVEKHLSDSGMSTVSSLLPNGFPAYARVFHPAYLNDDEEQPVRWSTVASWTGRTVHPPDAVSACRRSARRPSLQYTRPTVGFASDGRVDPGSGVPYPVRNAQGLHHNPRHLLLLPMGRLGKHRHPPLQGRFSCESASPRPSVVPQSYRRHNGFSRNRLASRERLEQLAEHLVAGGPVLVRGNGHRPVPHIYWRQPGVHRGDTEPPGPGGVAHDPRRVDVPDQRHHTIPPQ